MKWFIELLGDHVDLGELARSLSLPGVAVVQQDDKFLLQLSDLEPEIEPRTVVDKAKNLLPILNGTLRLGFDARESIQLGSVHRLRDGKRDYFLLQSLRCFTYAGLLPQSRSPVPTAVRRSYLQPSRSET